MGAPGQDLILDRSRFESRRILREHLALRHLQWSGGELLLLASLPVRHSASETLEFDRLVELRAFCERTRARKLAQDSRGFGGNDLDLTIFRYADGMPCHVRRRSLLRRAAPSASQLNALEQAKAL